MGTLDDYQYYKKTGQSTSGNVQNSGKNTASTPYTYTPPALVEEDQKQFQSGGGNSYNYNAANLARQMEAANAKKKEIEEQQRKAEEQRQKQLQWNKAEQEYNDQYRAQADKRLAAQEKATQAQLSKSMNNAYIYSPYGYDPTTGAPLNKSGYVNTPVSQPQSQMIVSQPDLNQQRQVYDINNYRTDKYYQDFINQQKKDTTYVLQQPQQQPLLKAEEEEPSIKPPNANLISQANAANPYNPPTVMPNLGFSLTQGLPLPKAQRNDEETYRQLQAQRQQYDNAAQVNAYLGYGYSGSKPKPLSKLEQQGYVQQSLATTGTAVNMTPGLANVENINIPASSTVPNAGGAGQSIQDYQYMKQTGKQQQGSVNNLGRSTGEGYPSPATGESNLPYGTKVVPSQDGKSKVILLPYKKGGYLLEDLEALGMKPQDGLKLGYETQGKKYFEGYYFNRQDGKYYPVNYDKARYAIEKGADSAYDTWAYKGYNPDMAEYYKMFGTYYGYTPSWRTTAFANASGAGKSGGGSYSWNTGSGSGNNGNNANSDQQDQRRYYNDFVTWTP